MADTEETNGADRGRVMEHTEESNGRQTLIGTDRWVRERWDREGKEEYLRTHYRELN